MFGVAVARLDALNDQQKDRYNALYCGLCHSLHERYGNVGRATLSYDLTFLTMLLDSLFEPPEESGEMRCASHPYKGVRYTTSTFTDYCADLSVALAYNKCLDDVVDERTLRARAAKGVLTQAYRKAKDRIPEHCFVIEAATQATFEIESLGNRAPADAASIAFGDMLGFLFEENPLEASGFATSQWRGALRAFGEALGRFIYMMDAAVDFRDDEKSGSYNPFVNMRRSEIELQELRERHAGSSSAYTTGVSRSDPVELIVDPDVGHMRDVLSILASSAADIFERLPLVQDVDILRCILYAGVWQKFNLEYDRKRASDIEEPVS